MSESANETAQGQRSDYLPCMRMVVSAPNVPLLQAMGPARSTFLPQPLSTTLQLVLGLACLTMGLGRQPGTSAMKLGKPARANVKRPRRATRCTFNTFVGEALALGGALNQ